MKKDLSQMRQWVLAGSLVVFIALAIVVVAVYLVSTSAPASAYLVLPTPSPASQKSAANVVMADFVPPPPAPTAALTSTPVRFVAPPLAGTIAPSEKEAEELPTPTVVVAPTPLPPLPGLVPRRLRIPTININTVVEHVGLDSQQRMDVPVNYANVAWFKPGFKPGERGNAAIAGHVSGPYAPAIFFNLHLLAVGGRIFVQDEQGQEKEFEVFEVGTYRVEEFPIQRVFGDSDEAHINLITCIGTFNPSTATYDKRLVVYARLVK